MTNLKFTSPSGETIIKVQDTGRLGTVAPKTKLHIKMDEPVQYETPMTTKTQLQNKIQELEAELQEFKKQLGSYKETPTLQEANVGDTLEDGSIVLSKENGLALLVAPEYTEVMTSWSQEFTEVFKILQDQGFNPSQWFVPTVEQLKLAYKTIPGEFSTALYWSSTEYSATNGCDVNFTNGIASNFSKTSTVCVRAFRCVTY